MEGIGSATCRRGATSLHTAKTAEARRFLGNADLYGCFEMLPASSNASTLIAVPKLALRGKTRSFQVPSASRTLKRISRKLVRRAARSASGRSSIAAAACVNA